MNGAAFTSVFAADLERFLAFKKSMGFHGNGREWYLRNFDRYCTENGLEEFDRSTVEGWILSKQPSLTDSFPSWRSFIRDFGRWLLISGNENAYVLSDRWKTSNVRTQPYLLRSEEIIKFFEAAPRLETTSAWKWQGLAFFALMYSCGLRTCEVRRLALEDVNLAERFIDVRWSKGNRSRQLPITDQLLTILAAADQALELAVGKQRTAFFANQSGHQLTASTVGLVFHRIWDQAGLPRSPEGKQPAPYSFRHHFAYANIERWMADGTDVNAMLPYLSRYMGHASLDSTYYYIHTSPDFMNGYADIVRDGQGILPEVGFE